MLYKWESALKVLIHTAWNSQIREILRVVRMNYGKVPVLMAREIDANQNQNRQNLTVAL